MGTSAYRISRLDPGTKPTRPSRPRVAFDVVAGARYVARVFENLSELYQYRALLWNLISQELKVRYRGSVLGFFWTFLNPLLQMAVYSLVFSVYMRSDEPNYTYFLFVGLLPWNWFATSLLTGTSAISDRRDLISKVKFPPQILPATVMGSALLNYLFTLPLMLAYAIYLKVPLGLPLLAFPVVIFAQMLLTFGLVHITATLNVAFRDLQHILGNLVMFAFFLTPVLYPVRQLPERYQELVLLLNPMATLIQMQRDIFVSNQWPDGMALLRTLLIGLLVYIVGASAMANRREDFAEVA